MLILGRHVGESILIGDGIRIVVLACSRRGVRLGIEAPLDASILREEIVVALAAENQRASSAGSDTRWLELLQGAGPQPPSAETGAPETG